MRLRYEAARADGASVRGVVEAPSVSEAAALLSGRGLFPIAVEHAPGPATWGWRRPGMRAQATLFTSLASLVEAGVPLEKALVASERVTSGALKEVLGRVTQHVREGGSLAAALGAEQGLFAAVTVGLVRAGERGVGLATGLAQAAAELEARAELAARVRGALAYPALLAGVGSASVAFIVGFVVPRFAALLSDVGQALPAATRALLAASEILRGFGPVLGALVVALSMLAARLARDRRSAWHGWLLRQPVIGPIRHALASARVARTLGALLGTGTPALRALAVAREAVGDAGVADRLDEAHDRVAQGSALSASLGAVRAISATAVQLAAIGEGSGRLPALLAKAAELDQREAERRIRMLVTLLEPALILGFAALVALVAAALLQAVYALRP